jgi:hypothetical protein
VRRVLSEAVIFDWRLRPQTERLSERLGEISSAAAAASHVTTPAAVSMQSPATGPP